MLLKLRRADLQFPKAGWPPSDDHLVVMHGEHVMRSLQRIHGGPANNAWTWSITALYVPPGVMTMHGREDTKEEAKAAFGKTLRAWLSYIGADELTEELLASMGLAVDDRDRCLPLAPRRPHVLRKRIAGARLHRRSRRRLANLAHNRKQGLNGKSLQHRSGRIPVGLPHRRPFECDVLGMTVTPTQRAADTFFGRGHGIHSGKPHAEDYTGCAGKFFPNEGMVFPEWR
jgi:hypothetical protein